MGHEKGKKEGFFVWGSVGLRCLNPFKIKAFRNFNPGSIPTTSTIFALGICEKWHISKVFCLFSGVFAPDFFSAIQFLGQTWGKISLRNSASLHLAKGIRLKDRCTYRAACRVNVP